MHVIVIIAWILILGLNQTAVAASDSADTEKKEGNKSLTVEDMGRGLKDAARNVEKEIPKIGPAIRDAVKNLNKTTTTQKPDDQSKEKK